MLRDIPYISSLDEDRMICLYNFSTSILELSEAFTKVLNVPKTSKC